MSDHEELIRGCKNGNRSAQEKLFKLYAGKMLGVCVRYFQDRVEAEDVLQDGFIKVFQKIDSFRNDGSFEGWIRKIMVNTALEQYRKNKNLYAVVDAEEVQEDLTENFLIESMDAKYLLKLIHELPSGYKAVFNLYAIEGYGHKEIAELLGISEGTSKSQLARARALLKKKLSPGETLKVKNHVG